MCLPIVTADTARIFGYEALVRCQADELRSPLVLFDIAERSGRIRPLNRTLKLTAGLLLLHGTLLTIGLAV